MIDEVAGQPNAELEAVLDTNPEKQPQTEEITPVKEPSTEEKAVETDFIENAKERNFARLREQAEKARRERDDAVKRMQELEARQAAPPPVVDEPDIELGLGEDEIAEGKHLSKLDQKIKKLERLIYTNQQQNVNMTTASRLKNEYPDFENVVSKTNMDELKTAYPELAYTLDSSTDLYAKAVSAYTMIKKLGIHVSDETLKTKAVALKNAAKPRPLTSISPQLADTPLSSANAFSKEELTPELKNKLLEEMREARKYY